MENKREDLPKVITSPISGDKLELRDISHHNDNELSVMVDYDDGDMEFYDDVVMYSNDETKESFYTSVKR